MLSQSSSGRILYVVADIGYFTSHRLSLAVSAKECGYEVILASDSRDFEQHREMLEKQGISVMRVPFDRAGMNLFKDLWTIRELYRVIGVVQPSIVHNVAMKPILYGSFAAKLRGVPRIINAIAGFGIVFSGTSRKARLLKLPITYFLKLALKKSGVIVQNHVDFEMVKRWVGKQGSTHLILGAGVDCSVFKPAASFPATPMITFVSRMLWSKGVKELVEAAKMLKNIHPEVIIQCVGEPDMANPDHVPTEFLQKWHDGGVIKWMGRLSDIAKIYHNTSIAVLPSYREGLPKSLLEACACGLPIVTTDVPGCREVVEEGVNGILVPAKDAKALFVALDKLLSNTDQCRRMGIASRKRAMDLFEDKNIQEQTLDVYAL